ncbi:hypothetical protein ACWE42_05005 [Sutcliffiella cohnii]
MEINDEVVRLLEAIDLIELTLLLLLEKELSSSLFHHFFRHHSNIYFHK